MIIESSSFHMCAPFSAMEFLKTFVRALGTYKSPLSFDRVVLVEMFEIGVNNAHIIVWCQPVHCFIHQLRLSVFDALR